MFVLDASVWVALYVTQDVHHSLVRRWLFQALSRGLPLLAPSIVLSEVAGAISRRTGSAGAGWSAASQLMALPEMGLVSLDLELAQRSAELAATLRLRGADASYVAVAVLRGAALVTLDEEMSTRSAAVVSSSGPWDMPAL